MKHTDSVKFMLNVIMGVCLWSEVTLSASIVDFETLLNNIIEQQPEQKIIEGVKELHSSNQNFSNSWVAGDVDLIVHHENDSMTDDEDYQNWQVGVEFPLWLPDQKEAQRQIANSYGREVSAQQVYLRWQASKILRDLAWNYKIASIEVEAAHSTLKKIRSLQHKVKQKVQAGESPKIDLLLANKRVLKQQNQLVKTQSTLTIAENQFEQWTHYRQPPEQIKERVRPPVVLEQHPKIMMLMAYLQISQAMRQKTKSFKRDSPRLYLGAQSNKDQNVENTSLMFEVSFPLGMSASYSPKLATENRQVYEQQARVEKEKIALKQAIFKARQTLASAKQSIHFTKEQYNISQKALSMSETAYQLGDTNIQNLLLVQQETAEAKREYQLVQAQSGRAIAHLNQISGHILGDPQ